MTFILPKYVGFVILNFIKWKGMFLSWQPGKKLNDTDRKRNSNSLSLKRKCRDCFVFTVFFWVLFPILCVSSFQVTRFWIHKHGKGYIIIFFNSRAVQYICNFSVMLSVFTYYNSNWIQLEHTGKFYKSVHCMK